MFVPISDATLKQEQARARNETALPVMWLAENESISLRGLPHHLSDREPGALGCLLYKNTGHDTKKNNDHAEAENAKSEQR